jgi:hypothetical protein
MNSSDSSWVNGGEICFCDGSNRSMEWLDSVAIQCLQEICAIPEYDHVKVSFASTQY